MFLIKEVEIEGFRSHSHSKVSFEKGINLIAGRNGAGKSSILDAILVALYSSSPTGTKKENLIRDGAGGYKIKLRFVLGDKEYEIVRSSGRGTLLRGDGLLIDGDSRVTEWVEKILGPAHVFTNAIYVRQGEIDGIVRDDESREKVIKKVTRIEDYDNAWNNMHKLIKEFERERDNYKNFVEKYEDSEEDLRKREEELKEREEKLKKKTEEERRTRRRSKEALQKLDELKGRIDELETR